MPWLPQRCQTPFHPASRDERLKLPAPLLKRARARRRPSAALSTHSSRDRRRCAAECAARAGASTCSIDLSVDVEGGVGRRGKRCARTFSPPLTLNTESRCKCDVYALRAGPSPLGRGKEGDEIQTETPPSSGLSFASRVP